MSRHGLLNHNNRSYFKQVQANEDCAKAFEEVSSANITPTKMCAIDEESIQDACQGDSGGPLMLPFRTEVDGITG